MNINPYKYRKNKRTRVWFTEGYFTVEAAFLIPFSILLFVFIIYLGIFLYNKCVAVQVCYVAALRGSQEKVLGDSQVEEKVYSDLAELLNGKVLMNPGQKMKAEVCFDNITVTCQSEVKTAVEEYSFVFTENFPVLAEGTARRWNPTKYIRIYQRLK